MNPVLPLEVLVPLLAALVAGGAWAAWAGSDLVPRRTRIAMLALRGLGLAAIAALALNPGRWKAPIRHEDSEWALLVDRSGSMAWNDAGGSRWDAARGLAARAVGAETDPRRARIHPFAESLGPAADKPAVLAKSAPDGTGTDLAAPLLELLDRHEGSGRRLAGIILLSDGRHLGAAARLDEAAARARAFDAPVYALPLGGPVDRRDLSIRAGRRQYVAFPGQKVTVAATVESRGLGPVRARVRLLAADGRELAAREADLADPGRATVEFSHQPGGEGYEELRLAVAPLAGEASTVNNEATAGVLTLAAPIRLLFVEGAPHWDSKFVVQLLRRQPHLRVTTVHRVKEERFFRQDAGTETASETISAFPDDTDTLAAYDAIAFGKGAEFILTPARAALLRQFVRDRGGAVLFCRGRPWQGDHAALDPLDVADWGQPVRQAFRWRPTAAGEQSGLFGEGLPGRDAPAWTTMATLDQAMTCPSLRPFSQVLMEGVTDGPEPRRFPVLITRRIGKGVVAAVNSEGLWRMDFFPRDSGDADLYRQFWVELVQWAVTHADFLPGRELAVRVSPAAVPPGTPVKITVMRRRAGEAPSLALERGGQRVQEASPREASPGSGEYAAIVTPSVPGLYRAVAAAGAESAAAGFEVTPPPREQDEVSADPDALARLAGGSGGRVIRADEIEEIVRGFAPKPVETDAEPVWNPWWDRGWVLAGLVGLLAGEWVLRRRNGLA